MTHWFHPGADNEFLEAISYYEDCQDGLGQDFYTEVISTIGRILELPSAWPVFDGDVRRCLTHRFPYGILYSIEEGSIFILAVMHLQRDPDYWKHRSEK